MKELKITQALQEGWKATKANFWMLAGFVAVFALLGALGNSGTPEKLVFELVSMALSAVLMLVCLRIIRADGVHVGGIGDLPLSTGKVLQFLWVNLVYLAIVFGGFLLLVVPGFYWALKYQYAPLLALDEDLPLGEALKRSAALTEGVKWSFLTFTIYSIGIALLGLLALVVGLIPAFLTIHLAWVWLFEDLKRQEAAGSRG